MGRSKRELQRSIDGLAAHAAVLDGRGHIVAVNERWRRFAWENGLRDPGCGVGASYLAACESPTARDTEGPAVAVAIRRVLARREQPFRRAYACHGPRRAAWFRVEVASLHGRGLAGALVTHVPVDEREMRREIADEERRHISRELHDTTAQNLTVALLDLENVARAERARAGAVSEPLAEAIALVQRSLGEVRCLSYELAPPGLVAGRLVESLKRLALTFARRTGFAVMLAASPFIYTADGDDELTREGSEALYRTAEETLYNARRHSGGHAVTLRVQRSGASVIVDVEDDGKGMAANAAFGKGLTDARERLEAVGGELEISSARNGLVVRAVVPVGGNHAVDRPGG